MKKILKQRVQPAPRRRYAFQNKAFIMVPLVLIGIVVLYLQFDWVKKNYKGRVQANGVETIRCGHCHGSGLVRADGESNAFVMCRFVRAWGITASESWIVTM
jgi:hypothetical protein